MKLKVDQFQYSIQYHMLDINLIEIYLENHFYRNCVCVDFLTKSDDDYKFIKKNLG